MDIRLGGRGKELEVGPVIGFMVGVAVAAAVFALALWRQVRRYKRLETQIGTGEQILERALAKAEGRHLWRVKTIAPVVAGVELARRNPLPSMAAAGAAVAVATGAALLIPVTGDKRGLDAEMAPAQPSVPVVVEPAKTGGTDPELEPEPEEDQVGEDEPEVAVAVAPAGEPDTEVVGPPATTTTTSTTLVPTTPTTAAASVTIAAVPDLPEIPTPLVDPEPQPDPEPEPRGCTVGLSANLAGARVSVCV